jgi:hypothetical protein
MTTSNLEHEVVFPNILLGQLTTTTLHFCTIVYLARIGHASNKVGGLIMKKLVIVFCLVSTLLGASFLSYAGKPPGLEKQGKTPPGFTKGKKTGWQNDYPPGWGQKSGNGNKGEKSKQYIGDKEKEDTEEKGEKKKNKGTKEKSKCDKKK